MWRWKDVNQFKQRGSVLSPWLPEQQVKLTKVRAEGWWLLIKINCVRGIEIQDSASEMEQFSSHEDLEHVLKRVGSVSMEQKLNQLRTASKWVVYNSDKINNSDTGQMRRRLA